QLLHNRNDGQRTLKSLILSPTRELAIQIDESFAAYGKHTGLKHTVVFGGVSIGAQISTLRNGVDVLVATPGRLLDLLNQRALNLSNVEIFVLDEADRMLDMGFINDVKKITAKIPQKKQTLFFSATMPSEIAGLANSILNNTTRVEVTPTSSTVEKITQAIYPVEKKDKPSLLIHLLKDKKMNSVLVFTRTKHGADKLVKVLSRASITSAAIHGNKSQNARQKALSFFKDGKIRVLVATDIAARGIDVDQLSYVVNFDLPNQPETYVHRIGRTGRAGLSGSALSFCDHEERAFLQDINKLTAQKIPLVEDLDGKIRVLVATDIAARGIDVDQLSYVVNFDLPNQPETYVHRIGRTGRAGLSGSALSFCDHEERAFLQDINKLTAQKIPLVED